MQRTFDPLRFAKVVQQIWDRSIGELLVRILTGLIRIYQLTISRLLGPVCRYYPSCSHYGYEAIKVHRTAKGLLLTAWRILRCNPWAKGGMDMVPARGHWPKSPNTLVDKDEPLENSVSINDGQLTKQAVTE